MDTLLWNNENFWVSGYNFDPETVAGHHISDNLKIHAATLRDGQLAIPAERFLLSDAVIAALFWEC